MTITDAQVEAALDAFGDPENAYRAQAMRSALEAADRAAWITDMDAAPPLERIMVSGIYSRNVQQPYRWWEKDTTDGNGRPIDHPTADMWRPLPLPPEVADD